MSDLLKGENTVTTVHLKEQADGTYAKFKTTIKDASRQETEVEVIEPRFSTTRADYMDYNTSTTVIPENYEIVYTATINGQVYTATRRVKLRYRVGDINFDGDVTAADGSLAELLATSAEYMFPLAATNTTYKDKYQREVADMNNDGSVGPADGSLLEIVATAAHLPRMRW